MDILESVHLFFVSDKTSKIPPPQKKNVHYEKYCTKYSIFAYPHEILNKVFCFITGRFIMSVPVCWWHLRLDQLRFICRIEFYPDFYCQFIVPSMETAGSAKTNQGKFH